MPPLPKSEDLSIQRDIQAVNSISAVASILQVICDDSGMGFATVARVTDSTWTACAVQDNVGFGLRAGEQLELQTTLCYESRTAKQPIVVDHFSEDPIYAGHHTAKLYRLESYISVPIILSDGTYFGNLCAIDARPAKPSDARVFRMFEVFAKLIALQLEGQNRQQVVEARLMNEEATSELREQFIAVLGHDLRNPLSAVGASAELLIRRKDDPTLVKIGQRLTAATLRMARLIDDVMDFARGRMGSGISVLLYPAERLEIALQEVVTELRTAHPDRTIIDQIKVDRIIYCDRGRVQQLLSNLLGNAITHGAADQPIIVSTGVENAALVINVRNMGDMIAPDTIQKVFEPYWRPPTSKPGGGLGLGLFICKQIVKAHGGTLSVQSSEREGTTFTACLPCDLCQTRVTENSIS